MFTLRQTDSVLRYHLHTPTSSPEEDRTALMDYLRLDVNLASLYSEWAEKDPIFRVRAAGWSGVRLLKQDPLETLIAFICSSNNNVPRISLMMNRLCQRYGHPLGHHSGIDHYTLPSLETLAGEETEGELRALGFGYRAKYIHQTARLITGSYGGVEWLHSLRGRPYSEAWRELQQLPGVGGKVADCVCLMGLGKLEAVPVDTHVWRITVRDYDLRRRGESLTAKVYQEVGVCEGVCSVQSNTYDCEFTSFYR